VRGPFTQSRFKWGIIMNKLDKVITKASTTVSKQLIGEYKALIADAEALIEANEGHVDDVIKTIRSKALKTLAGAKEGIADFEDVLTDKAEAAAKGTDHFVHGHPWESVGLAAGLGLIIGLIIRRS
jgi:ElaB/YqjD/DUF883 family membrane-anchored ribosome-binding protein